MPELFDHDYVASKDGFIFCVLGYEHPKDAAVAYLKYIESSSGKWGFGERKFERRLRAYSVPAVLDTISFLREKNPRYVRLLEPWGIEMSVVPKDLISQHLRPQNRLAEMMETQRRDELEELVVQLVELLSKEAGVEARRFGVTGSVLAGIHNPSFSDIDLTVHGKVAVERVAATLRELLSEEGLLVRRFSGSELRSWCADKAKIHPISERDAERLYERMWNRGVFRGRMFSVHPIRGEEEVGWRYGDRVYRAKGFAKVVLRVVDDLESAYLPGDYLVNVVEVLEGSPPEDLRTLTTFEGLYGGVFEEGDLIEVFGKVEEVTDLRKREVFYRLVVGSPELAGKDYAKLI